MKLSELRPEFLKHESPTSFRFVDNIKEADGIMFACPVCYKEKGNTLVGVHRIICWQPHISQETSPKPGRWYFDGTSLDDITLRNGSSSILLEGAGCKAHFFIRNGEIC